MTRACYSMLELLDLRDGAIADDGHLEACRRCRALYESLGDIPTPSDIPQQTLKADAPPAPDGEGSFRSGELWLTAPDENGNREVVAVIGRPPVGDDLLLVAPTATELHQGADGDLLVEASPLGYPHLVCVWAHGAVRTARLVEYRGRLDRPLREDLVATYRWLLGGAEMPRSGRLVQPGLAGPGDVRLRFRARMADRLRSLWRDVDAALEEARKPIAPVVAHPTLGRVLQEVLAGGTWDEPTLLEATGISGTVLRSIMRDSLDVVHRSDVEAVARVVTAIGLDDPLAHARATLEAGEGGLAIPPKSAARLAARSYADVGEDARRRDLLRGREKIDKSPGAHKKAIETYLRELEAELHASQ